jgi:hypothetical protein
LGVLWQVDMQLRQAPFAHHRGQVGDVGYGPQRMFINSWRDVWWNIIWLWCCDNVSCARLSSRHCNSSFKLIFWHVGKFLSFG